MNIKVYSSLTKQKESLSPMVPGKIGIYVCGITVYDYCHIGHARAFVVFDLIVRYLRWRGYQVTFVRNITDIDDKIIQRAAETGQDWHRLTEHFIRAMHEDMRQLGMQPPDLEPRATEYIPEIIDLVGRLEDKGFAYQGASGDVYYRVEKFPDYGKLSHRRLEDMQAGSRVEVSEDKAHPLDFVLWKSAKPGEPSWPSPWGEGRPGWHIECSAMSTSCLGNHFDIHGGGQDLLFPHHENEIAQSEAGNGETFVNYWLHNGFVQIDEEKMSKSLGNFHTIRDILAQQEAEVVRYFLCFKHYRAPLNYSAEALDNATQALTRLYLALQKGSPESGVLPETDQHVQAFRAAMDDDFNTPEALAVLFELAKQINRETQPRQQRILAARLRQLGGVLGLLQQDPEQFLKGTPLSRDRQNGALTPAEIDTLVSQRDQARAAKDWPTADRIRDQLLQAGILLEDGAGGTGWRRN